VLSEYALVNDENQLPFIAGISSAYKKNRVPAKTVGISFLHTKARLGTSRLKISQGGLFLIEK
jgi:hypothetical protein